MENIQTLIAQHPLVEDLVALKETTWFNPGTTSLAEGLPYVGLTAHDVEDAHARLTRFAPYLAQAFPETAATGALSNLSWPQSLPCKNGWKKSSGNTLTAKSC